MLALAALVLVRDVEHLGKVLAQMMRRAGLQRLAVAHKSFNCKGILGTGKAFGVALLARVNGDRQLGLDELAITLEHANHLLSALLFDLTRPRLTS